MFTIPHQFTAVCVFFFLWAGVLKGQSSTNPVTGPNVRFGRITPADFSQKPTVNDSTVEAVVLYERGDVRFSYHYPDMHITFNYHCRIRILKKSGYKHATVEVPVYKTGNWLHEVMSDIEGYTYNNEGGAVRKEELKKAGIFTEKVSKELSIKKFTLPDVREGSIIEYHYQLFTPFSVNYNPRTWTFQKMIPVLWSEYRIEVPENYYYKMILSGALPLDINEHEKNKYRFAMQHVPAFRSEEFIPAPNDYLSKIDFELASASPGGQSTRSFSVNWDDLDNTLLGRTDFDVRYMAAQGDFLRTAADSINRVHADTLARLAAACRYVTSRIKWNGASSIFCYGVNALFQDKTGDSGDINMALAVLLRQMGLDANPVILSTRSHGSVNPSIAMFKQFNYVVAHVMVNGKDMLLDATSPFQKTGLLPAQCLNGSGRLVLPGKKSRFVSLDPTERNIESSTGSFTISADVEVSGTLNQSHGGYNAVAYRALYVLEGKDKYMKLLKSSKPSWQLTHAECSGYAASDQPFDVACTLTVADACMVAGDHIYLKPLLTEGRSHSPFKEPERIYPVDFGAPVEESYVATFTLPAGYETEEMPQPLLLSMPGNGGRFTYQVSQDDRQLKVVSRFVLRKAVYGPDEYPVLRQFFDKVVAKQAEQIVIRRSAPVATKK